MTYIGLTEGSFGEFITLNILSHGHLRFYTVFQTKITLPTSEACLPRQLCCCRH